MKKTNDKKQEVCKNCKEQCPAFGGKPSACALNIMAMKEYDEKDKMDEKDYFAWRRSQYEIH